MSFTPPDHNAEAKGPDQQVLGHYELQEQLGEGGMGIVYRARDARLGRFVALKVLRPESLEDPGRKERFVREAMLASALNHPNIITIHDIQHDGGRDFIVMEWVEGRSLREMISPDGLALDLVLPLICQIADAMAAAHSAGVIHRDLKPHNVMVKEEGMGGAQGRVKVLDFGVAKLSPTADPDPEGATLTELTSHGGTLGTLAYMAPEQLRGEAVDARADLFSLGVVCYELLTGQRPFRGATAVDLAHEIYFADPEPVSHLRPEVPVELDAILARALSKQRGSRQGSMEVFRSELMNLLSERDQETGGLDIEVAPEESPSPSEDVSTGHPLGGGFRWLLPAALLVAAVLTGVLIPSIREFLRLRGTPQPGTGETLLVVAEPSNHELYLKGLEQLELYYQPGQVDGAIETFQRMLAKDQDSAAAYAGLARAYLFKHRNESRDPSWREKALANARHAVQLNEDLAVTQASLGLVLMNLKEFEEAQGHLEQALVLDPFNKDAPRGLGQIQERLGHSDEAEAIYRQALTMRPEDRRLHDVLGALLFRTGRYDEAEALFVQSIELEPMSPFGHRNLAAVYHMQGRFSEAADQLQRVLALQPTASVYSNLGTLYFYQGLYQEALVAFEKALEFKGSPSNFRRWANLADAYRMTPDNEQKAQDAYLRAIQLVQKELAPRPSDADLQSYLALFLAKREDCEEALEELKRLEELEGLKPVFWFRITVANEICGRRDAALQALVSTLEAGYSLTEIQREPALLELRYDARYQQTVMRFEALRAKS